MSASCTDVSSLQAATAWKVWRTWSDPRLFGSAHSLDDSNVQKLAQNLEPSEKVSLSAVHLPVDTHVL